MAIGVPSQPLFGTAPAQESSDMSIAFQRGLRGLTGTAFQILPKGFGGEFLRTIGLEEQGNQWISDAYASGLLMGMDLNELQEQFKGPKTWREIPDAKGAIAYGVNTLADQMPTLMAQFAPAVAATVLRRFGAPIPKWVTPASVIATIDWLNTSEVYANLLMEAGESRPKVAAGTGALMSSLDMVLPLRVVNRMGNGLDFAKYVGKKLKTPRSNLRTALAGALEGGAIEGTTEYVQTIFENMALNYVKDNDLLAEFSDAQKIELEEAGVRGAIVGTFLGGAVSYVGAYRAAKNRANLYEKLSAFEEDPYAAGVVGHPSRGLGTPQRRLGVDPQPSFWDEPLQTMPSTERFMAPLKDAMATKIRDEHIEWQKGRGLSGYLSPEEEMAGIWGIESRKKLWQDTLNADMEAALDVDEQDSLLDIVDRQRVVAVETQKRTIGYDEWRDIPTGPRGKRAEKGWWVEDRHPVVTEAGAIKMRRGVPDSRNVYANEKYILRKESEVFNSPWVVIDKETGNEIDRNAIQKVLLNKYAVAPLAQPESVAPGVEEDERTRVQSQALEREMEGRGALPINVADKVRFERFNKTTGKWEVVLEPAVSMPSPLADPEVTGVELPRPGTGEISEVYTVQNIWYTSGYKRGPLKGKRPTVGTGTRKIAETKEAYTKGKPVSTVYELRRDSDGRALPPFAIPPNEKQTRLVPILRGPQKQPLVVGEPIGLAEEMLMEEEFLTPEQTAELERYTPEGERRERGIERVRNVARFRELMADEAFYDRFINALANAESKRGEKVSANVAKYEGRTEAEIEKFIADSNKSRTELGLPVTKRAEEEEKLYAKQASVEAAERLNEMERLALVKAGQARLEGMEEETAIEIEEAPSPAVPEGEVTTPLTEAELEGAEPTAKPLPRKRWREFKEWKKLLRAEEKELGVKTGGLSAEQIAVLRKREWGDKPLGEFIVTTKAEPYTASARKKIVGKAKSAITTRLEVAKPPAPRRKILPHLEGIPKGATLLDVIDIGTEALPAPETHEVRVLEAVAEEHGLNPQYYYPYEITGWTEHGLIRISGQHIRKEDIVEVREFTGKAKAPLLENFVEIKDAKQVYKKGAVEANMFLPDTIPGRETIRRAWVDNTTGIIVVQRDAYIELDDIEKMDVDYGYDYEIYLTWYNKEEHALKLKELKDRLLTIATSVYGKTIIPKKIVDLTKDKEFLTKDYEKNVLGNDVRITLKPSAIYRINGLRKTDKDAPPLKTTTEFKVFRVYGERTEPAVTPEVFAGGVIPIEVSNVVRVVAPDGKSYMVRPTSALQAKVVGRPIPEKIGVMVPYESLVEEGPTKGARLIASSRGSIQEEQTAMEKFMADMFVPQTHAFGRFGEDTQRFLDSRAKQLKENEGRNALVEFFDGTTMEGKIGRVRRKSKTFELITSREEWAKDLPIEMDLLGYDRIQIEIPKRDRQTVLPLEGKQSPTDFQHSNVVYVPVLVRDETPTAPPPPEIVLPEEKEGPEETNVVDVPSKEGLDTQIRLDTTVTITHSKAGRMGRQRKQTGKFVEFSYPEEDYFLGGRVKFVSDKGRTQWVALSDISFVYDETELQAAKEKERLEKRLATIASVVEKAAKPEKAVKSMPVGAGTDYPMFLSHDPETDTVKVDLKNWAITTTDEGVSFKKRETPLTDKQLEEELKKQEAEISATIPTVTEPAPQPSALATYPKEVLDKVTPVVADDTTKPLKDVNTTPLANLPIGQKFKDGIGGEWEVVQQVGNRRTLLKFVGGKSPALEFKVTFEGKKDTIKFEAGTLIDADSYTTPSNLYLLQYGEGAEGLSAGGRGIRLRKDKEPEAIPNYSVVLPVSGEGRFAYNTGLTPKTFREILGKKIGAFKLARLEKDGVIRIVQNQSDVPNPPRNIVVRAVERDGKVWFITNNIKENEIPGVFAHEIGVHVGLVNMYGDEALGFILSSARDLRDSSPLWRESFAAAESIYEKMDADMSAEERADFIAEEAIGIYTEATNPMTDSFWAMLMDWFRRQMGRAKQYFGKKLSEAEIIAFVRGGIRGTINRKFDEARVRNAERYSVLFGGLDDKFMNYVNDKLKDNDREWVDSTVGLGRSLKEKVATSFNPFKYLPQVGLFRTIRSVYQGRLGEIMEQGEEIKKIYKNLSEKEKEELYHFFINKDSVPTMITNPKLREASVRFKSKIMEIGKQAYDNKIIANEEVNKDQFDQLYGAYLPRIFLAHLLAGGSKSSNPFGMKASKLYWSEMRLDVDELTKELKGEITDPAYLVYKAITVPQMDMIIIDYLNTLSQRVAFEPSETIKKLDQSIKATQTKIKNEKDEGAKKKLKEELKSLKKKRRDVPAGDRVVAGTPWVLPEQWIRYEYTDPVTGKKRTKRTTVYAITSQIDTYKMVLNHAKTPAETKPKLEREIGRLEALRKEYYDRVGGTEEAARAYFDKKYDTKMFRQMPLGRRFGGLEGVWVRKEIYQDILGNSATAFGEQNLFSKMFSPHGRHAKIVGIWKTLKVPMNPPTVARNFVNNTMLLQLLGGVPFHRQPSLFLEAFREAYKGKRGREFTNSAISKNYGLPEKFTAYELAKARGIAASTMIASEINQMEQMLIDVERDGILSFTTHFQRLWKSAADWAGDKYQMLEVIGKTVYITDALEHQRVQLEEVRQQHLGIDGTPDITLEDAAVLRANEVLFDYSEVSPLVRGMRSSFFGAPFITYQTKVIPQLIKTAAHYPWRFLPYVMLFAGAQAAFGSMPFEDDDWDKLMRLAPEWLRNNGHGMLMPWKDSNGNWQVADLSYYFPWAGMVDLGGNIYRGELKQGAQEFGLIAPGWQLAVAILQNKDTWRGAQIVDPSGTASDKAMDMFNWMWGMSMPSIVTRSGLLNMPSVLESVVRLDPAELEGKIIDAGFNRTNRYGDPKRDITAALLSAIGLGVYPISPDARTRQLQRYQSEIQGYQRSITSARRDTTLSDKQEQRKINTLRERIDEARRKRSEFARGTTGISP